MANMEVTGSWTRNILTTIAAGLILFGCNPANNDDTKIVMRPAPIFNADSAFAIIAKQVEFGPRVPGTEEHRQCGDFLVKRLSDLGAQVTEQTGRGEVYSGKEIPLRNIIAAFHPDIKRRILLCAHWDTRPYADQDTVRVEEPIDGANDGGSGVAVLLEIARCISINGPAIGVDVILFDAQNQGPAAYDTIAESEGGSYSLGCRLWARNKGEYNAEYGILTNMIGARGAQFTLESISMQYAEPIIRKVWKVGSQIGYPHYFRFNRTRPITDDHTYVNEIAGIPCIDIIQYDNQTPTSFGAYWHTHSDNISVIDRASLKAVGQTVLQVLYNE